MNTQPSYPPDVNNTARLYAGNRWYFHDMISIDHHNTRGMLSVGGLVHMMTSSNRTFSALLALCAGNSAVTGEFPSQRPVTRNFDVFFDLHLNGWANNRDAGYLSRHHAYYDVIVMILRGSIACVLNRYNRSVCVLVQWTAIFKNNITEQLHLMFKWHAVSVMNILHVVLVVSVRIRCR